MSSRLEAGYADLANQHLDHIIVENGEQARIAAEALRSITDPSHTHHIPPSLQGRIESIQEMLSAPEMYAQPEHQDAFKRILLARVARKISELVAISSSELERRLMDQIQERDRAREFQERVARARPPVLGSEAHVVSEEDSLRQQMEFIAHHDLDEGAQLLQFVSESLGNDREFVLAAVLISLPPEIAQLAPLRRLV